jgi:hypothetical protein
MSASTVAFVLTVPHRVCAEHPQGRHTCDTLAVDAAEWLREWLLQLGATVKGPILGDVSRTEVVDLNRRESRGYEWRRDLDSRLVEMLGSTPYVFLVDVHSFDTGAPWTARAELEGRPRPVLAFLNDRKFVNVVGMPEALRNALPGAWRELVSVGGSPQNDIVARAREIGVRWSVLIEFSEAEARSDPDWLSRVTLTIARAMLGITRL